MDDVEVSQDVETLMRLLQTTMAACSRYESPELNADVRAICDCILERIRKRAIAAVEATSARESKGGET